MSTDGMYKVILPDSRTFDQPIAQLVDIGRHGVDSTWFSKRAASDTLDFDSIKPQANHSLIHLIAMGDTGHYGFNRNGDAFYKSARQLDITDPKWDTVKTASGDVHKRSADTFADHTERGLLDTYQTFSKFANVYKHHKNRPHKGDKVWGSVKSAAYNNPMERVELLIEVDNNEWSDDLEKLANGEDIPFSMACVLDPAFPVLTRDRGYVPIAQVNTSDLVYTHAGKWQKVTAINRRKYTGDVCEFSVDGLPMTLTITADHHMMASTRAMVSYIGGATEIRDWAHAEHLEANDFFSYLLVSGCSKQLPVDGVLSMRILCAAEDTRLDFITSWLDSEGAVDTRGIHWYCVNLNLALQLRDVLFSLDMPCTVSERGSEYSVTCAGSLAWVLADRSRKLNRFNKDFIYSDNATVPGVAGEHLYRIRSVKRSKVTDQITYNIEVDVDHSYSLGGLTSHNCKIPYDICSHCGHKAKNRDEYCGHLTDNMTDLLKEGSVVGAINDHMTFFDISRVRRPADRIAWSLRKAASGSLVRGADLALDGEFDLYPDVSVLMHGQSSKVAARLQMISKMAEIEKRIPMDARLHGVAKGVAAKAENKKMDSLCGKHEKLASLFKALADVRVCLPLEKFAQLVLGDTEDTNALVGEATQLLPYLYRKSNIHKSASNPAYDPSRVTDGFSIKIAQELVQDLSLYQELVLKRTITNVVSGSREHTDWVHYKQAATVSDRANSLLDQYASYQLGFLESVNDRTGLTQELVAVQNGVQ